MLCLLVLFKLWQVFDDILLFATTALDTFSVTVFHSSLTNKEPWVQKHPEIMKFISYINKAEISISWGICFLTWPTFKVWHQSWKFDIWPWLNFFGMGFTQFMVYFTFIFCSIFFTDLYTVYLIQLFSSIICKAV